MTCPPSCLPFLPMRCGPCPSRSDSGSSSTFGTEPVATTSLTGLPGQGIPSQPQRSNGRDEALLALNSAYNAVAGMADSRVKNIVLTKIEEAELWLTKVRPS